MKAVLLSGGVDSALVACVEKPNFGIFIDYGQAPAQSERISAQHVARTLNFEMLEVVVDARSVGAGLLASTSPSFLSTQPEWWPFRNQFLITLAAMRAVQESVDELLIGTIGSDNIFRDGTKGFVERMGELLSYQEGGLRLRSPASELSQSELFQIAGAPKRMMAITHSCHRSNVACGSCRGCLKRASLFVEIGLEST